MNLPKKDKYFKVVIVTMLITAFACFGAVFVVLKSSNSVLVPKETYREMKAVTERYQKLYTMQEILQKKALNDIDNSKQMNQLYKALANGLDDPYTVYMTAAEAEDWQKQVDQEKSVTSKMLEKKVGYIRIQSFAPDTAEQFETELKSMENAGAKALIFDLRGNGGGYTEQGIEVADRILPECTITSMVDSKEKMQYYNSDVTCTKLPYVVLVDKNTASASEIVTAAVKDNHGGKIIGEKTYGKGVFQKEKTFDDGSILHYTAGEFFTPSGSKINGVGITPDVALVSPDSEKFTDRDPVIAQACTELGF